jgi:predicted permease
MAAVSGSGGSVYVRAAAVSPHFFEVLQIPVLRGRWLGPADFGGTEPSVVISLNLARHLLGSAGDAVGHHLQVGGRAVTVVGVMGPPFSYPGQSEIWIAGAGPGFDFPLAPRTWSDLGMLGRLVAGVDIGAARAEFADMLRSMGTAPGQLITVHSLPEVYSSGYSGDLRLLLAASLLLLLACCANASGLLVVRAVERSQEIRLRVALGAGQAHLMLQALAASLTLVLPGTMAGLGLSWLAVQWLARSGASAVGNVGSLRFGGVGLLTVSGGAVVLALGCAIAPWLYWRRRARGAWSERLLAASSGLRTAAGRAVLTVQVAVAFALLAASAGVLARLAHIGSVGTGFQAVSVVAAELHLADSHLRSPRELAMTAADGVPGISEAALSSALPLQSVRVSDWYEELAGPARGTGDLARSLQVQGPFFTALGVRILAGRALVAPSQAAQPEVVVSAGLARQLAGGGRPEAAVGATISWDGATRRVVGVAADIALTRPGERGALAVYSRLEDSPKAFPGQAVFLVARNLGGPLGLRRLVSQLESAGIPVIRSEAMVDVVRQADARLRFALELLGASGAIALAIALVGVFTLMRGAAAARRHEIGVRLALGSTPGAVVRRLCVDGVQVASLGLAAGYFLLRFLMPLARSRLNEFPSPSGWVVLACAAGIWLAGAAASWLASRAASRVDPSALLRAL